MTRNLRAGTTRRELLKLSPVLVLGAFAVPALRDPLLSAGVNCSDAISRAVFRQTHLAPTFPDRDLVPLERFPYNFFDTADPGVDLERWTLQVGGAVSRPGACRLDQIAALPRVRHNTRQICVEGWDVIGRFGGARLGDFLDLV